MTTTSNGRETEQAMQDQSSDSQAQIDRATSTSIRRAIGERLRQSLQPETVGLPSRLQHLLDEMQRQDCDLAQGGTKA